MQELEPIVIDVVPISSVSAWTYIFLLLNLCMGAFVYCLAYVSLKVLPFTGRIIGEYIRSTTYEGGR